jgi:spore coat polysaccharide biosynthesis protein SpsF
VRTVAVVQARMGSSRLPGKVLADIGGDTMLSRVVGRLRAARTIDDVVIATTTNSTDDAVVTEAERLGAAVFRGSEDDVLARYIGAARRAHAGVVVRVTSDCPLLDPEVIDRVVHELREARADYASNTHSRTYPRGLDVEAMYHDTLERIGRLATSPAAREHVTALLMESPDQFSIRQVKAKRDDSDLRWTVDTLHDLALVQTLYDRLDLDVQILPYHEVVAHVRAHPELAAVNAHVVQKPWRGTRVA